MAAVGSLTFLSRIFGYVRDVLIGSIFGDSGISDVFFQAFRLPNLFRSLFAEGALNSAFVPIFSRIYHKDGKKDALAFACTIFTFLALVLSIMVVLFECNMPAVMGFLAPGFTADPEKFQMAVSFGYILFPYILFISLAALCAAVLNSLDQFAAATAAPILLNLFCIGFLAIFFNNQLMAGYALSWAALLAGIFQLSWVLLVCKRMGNPIWISKITFTSDTKRLLRKMIPGIASSGVYQINLIVSTMIASYVPLAVSYLAYADRINQFPLSVIGIAIGTVLLPLLARQLSAEKFEKALYVQNRVLQLSLVLTLPAAIAFHVISLPIIITLFQHGRFTPTMSQEVATILSIYSLCLPANVMVKIFATAFFSRGNTTTPMWSAVISILTNVIFTLTLFHFISYYGIAWAAVIASWVNSIVLGGLLYRSKFFVPDYRLKKRVPRVVLSSIIMGGFLYQVTQHVVPYFGKKVFLDAIYLLSLMASGFFVYLFFVVLFKGLVYQELKEDFKSTTDN